MVEIKKVVNCGTDGGELPECRHVLELRHRPFPLSERLTRIFWPNFKPTAAFLAVGSANDIQSRRDMIEVGLLRRPLVFRSVSSRASEISARPADPNASSRTLREPRHRNRRSYGAIADKGRIASLPSGRSRGNSLNIESDFPSAETTNKPQIPQAEFL